MALSPVLGFVDFGYMRFSFVADRYQYLAGIGLIAVLVGVAGRACQRGLGTLPAHRTRPARLTIGAAGAAILAVAGLLTWNQAGLYRDPGTFFTHVIAHNPQARSAHRNLGNYLLAEGRYGEAHAAYQIALEREPDAPQLFVSIAALLSKQGRKEEAIAHYRKALRLNPQDQTAMSNLAALLMNQKRYAAGLVSAQQAIALYPDDAKAHHMVGYGLFQLNRKTEALRHYDRALALYTDLEELKAVREQREKILASMASEGRQ